MTIRSSEELERALRELGLRCAVEEYDALAVAIPEPGECGFEREEVRRVAIELARRHGFSHLAVEIREPGRVTSHRATLPGD